MKRLLLASVAALAAATAPACAQKAKDTLRIAYLDQISTSDPYIDPQPETTLTSDAVYGKLFVYSPTERQVRPGLAESWTQVDPLTLDIKLREGVKFHDGVEFTADDAVYTLRYISDPKSNLRFGNNWKWIKSVEKTGPYSIRLVASAPTPFALTRLATGTPMFPAHLHQKFEGRGEFGRRSAVGTGPYKAEYIDAGKGVMLVRNDAYVSPGPWSPKPTIGRIHITSIPDVQTQAAQLMTGGIDVILSAPNDQTEQLAAMPNLTTTAIDNTVYYYLNLDALGRSGVEPLKKLEVRKALFQAIDRKGLVASFVAGGNRVKVINAPCTDIQVGCAVSNAPPDFNPRAAREALTRAGYANGFPVEITSIFGAHELAEAVAGQLRGVGVRATVARATMAAYRDKQTSGQLPMLVSHYSSGGLPDVSAVVDFYIGAKPRDYWGDAEMARMMDEAAVEMDSGKRDALYRRIFDRMNEMAYVLPISTHPAVLVHSREVTMPTISSLFSGVEYNNIKWAK